MLTVQPTDQSIYMLVNGEIKKEDLNEAASTIEREVIQHNKVRLIVEIQNLEGYDSVLAFLKDTSKTIQHYGDFEKIAIITDESWLSGLSSFTDLINPADVKHFSPQEKTVAEEWIKQ